MNRSLIRLALVLAVATSALHAQKPSAILGPGTGGANFQKTYLQAAGSVRTLSKDTIYILTGLYFVDSTASLVIPGGTMIRGDSASGGTLIVRRGARLNANGSPSEPIVFTSGKPAGTRRPGDWGGVIVLGKAPTNKPTTQQVEGGFSVVAPGLTAYGGTDPNDTSGVIRYVRIEFAGIAYSQDNEINGLTLGGVGRGTVLEYVQVSFANDDDFEFFGGTVDARYLVSWRSLDDNLDSDFGWSGRVQFAYITRDPAIFDASAAGSSNGFESDNEGSAPFAATPRTSPRLSNVTLVGPAQDSAAANALNSKWQYVAMIRRSSELSIYNSILTGYRQGINLRDTLTQAAALRDSLQIRNTSIAVPREIVRTSSSPATGVPPGFNVTSWFNTLSYGNTGGSTPRQGTDLLPSTAWTLGSGVNPVPAAGSEAATAGTSFTGSRLQGDSWFTPVSYRGAFDPAKPFAQQWTAGWTDFDPQGTATSVEAMGNTIPESFTLDQNYPNPFNPSTKIRFNLPNSGQVTLRVYNMLGQAVATLVDQVLAPGSYETTFEAGLLASGTYVYRLEAGKTTSVRKMLLLR